MQAANPNNHLTQSRQSTAPPSDPTKREIITVLVQTFSCEAGEAAEPRAPVVHPLQLPSWRHRVTFPRPRRGGRVEGLGVRSQT